MKLGYNLNLKQTQKLSMTPELQQAIKLLQFNSLELNEYIKEQIQENPLLELENSKDNTKEKEVDVGKDKDRDEEIDWKEYVEKYDDISYRSQIDKNKEATRYENFVSYTPSLREYLLEQIGVIELDKEIKLVAIYIIENLDANGYLNMNLLELSSLLNKDLETIERALETVQSLDPVGVGSIDLRDCLLIQLKNKGIGGLIEKITKNHLEDLASNRLVKIAKDLDVSIDKVQYAIDYIKTLEPKPGRAFNNDNLQNVRYITPDASIEIIDGEFIVKVNESAGPRLNINSFYKNLIEKSSDDEAKEFLVEKLNSASWVIKSIEQRRATIKKVIESILKYQMDFFTEDKNSLNPLTQKTVAEDIDMHESTVSRIANGKYVQTPKGVFEIKYFFATALESSGGDISANNIKAMIEDIIGGENPKKPYSDQKIVDILEKKGVDISRRTAAKYRDELDIPSSTMRKRFD